MQAQEQLAHRRVDAEQRFLLEGVPWWAYVALRDALEDTGTRMTYVEGTLELMSPSETHEEEKKLIARLIEAWADEKNVDLRGFGSTTYRREAEKRGLEPDECYVLGPKEQDAVPQIAIEVVVASPLVDKLDVYAGLGIPEVWVWHSQARSVVVHRLVVPDASRPGEAGLRAGATSARSLGAGYEQHHRSAVLADLDLALLASFVRPGESHTALAKAYRLALRGSDCSMK